MSEAAERKRIAQLKFSFSLTLSPYYNREPFKFSKQIEPSQKKMFRSRRATWICFDDFSFKFILVIFRIDLFFLSPFKIHYLNSTYNKWRLVFQKGNFFEKSMLTWNRTQKGIFKAVLVILKSFQVPPEQE